MDGTGPHAKDAKDAKKATGFLPVSRQCNSRIWSQGAKDFDHGWHG